MSRYRSGSESEGLGFNLCLAPPHIVMSLILRDKGQVRDDFVIKTKVGQG